MNGTPILSPGCPTSWSALLAHRAAGGPEPDGFAAALAHLDGCRACRREALALDPTLVFRRLPAPEIDEAAEVAAMQDAVRAMRRTRAMTGAAAEPPARARRRPLVRAAAAAALLAVGLFAGSGRETPPPAARLAAARPTRTAVVPAALPVSTPRSVAATEPLVEPLGRSPEVVYQVQDGGLAVVMIVDADLDV